jgi:carbon storage regulator CsrA
MLNLLRQIGQSLRIGNDIKVKVINISTDQQRVRLKVDAPKGLQIRRSPQKSNKDMENS